MFHWSKKVVKSVTFSPEVADESLLAIVESVLEKQPNKTFSDLCKEALWQSLCVPEAVRPGSKTNQMEQQIAGLQHQLDTLEQRFFAKEANRLESIEAQLNQLTQQLTQLVLLVNQRPVFESSQPLPQLLELQEEKLAPPPPPQEIDPVLSRLTPFLDDF